MTDAVSQFESDVGIASGVEEPSHVRERLWRRFSLRKQMMFGFVVPVLIVLLAALALVRALDDLKESEAAIAESTEAMGLRYALLNLVLSAETGLRGYLISGDPEFLEPYHAAWQGLGPVYARLEQTEADEPAHIERLREARALFLHWRDDFAEKEIALRLKSPVGLDDDLRSLARELPAAMGGTTTDVMSQAHPGGSYGALLERVRGKQRLMPAGERATRLAALLVAPGTQAMDRPRLLAMADEVRATEEEMVTIVHSKRGKRLIDRIRVMIQASFQDEQVEQRNDAFVAAGKAERVRWIALIAPAFALAIGLSLILLLMFDAIRAISATTKAAVAVARGDLDKRVRVMRRDEIGALGAAFNVMAAELADRRRRSAALDRFQAMLVTSNTEAELHDVVSRLSAVLFPGVAGAIYTMAASRDLVERVAQWNWPEGANGKMWHPDECRAMRTTQPYYSAADTVEIPCLHTSQIGVPVGRSLCLPLSAQGEVFGILQLCRFGEVLGDVAPQQRETAAQIAEQLSMALANLQLREKLRNQSIRDPLTGLFNRRFLEETMARELARAARSGQPLVAAVIDVDHFKLFNDRFGHEAGDLVLVELAALFQKFVRKTDIVCRYGGEEFVLVMPDSSLPDATERVNALRT